MITIGSTIINGVSCPVSTIPQLGFGVKFDGENYLVFETQQEADESISPITLDVLKINKNNAIDTKTQELVYKGFQFDGHTFSLSDNAQRSWNGLAAGIGIGLFTIANFPLTISDVNNEKYELSWLERLNFLGVIAARIAYCKTSGSDLKQQVLDAQTEQEFLDIIDDRQ